MSRQDDQHEWLPLKEAAARLGVSESTVLRMIKDDQIVGDKRQRSLRDRRPQWEVRFDRSPQPPPDPPEVLADPPTIPHEPSEAVTLALLEDARSARRLADERLETIAALMEQRARLTAERDAAKLSSEAATSRLEASEQQAASLAESWAALTVRLAEQAADLEAERAKRRWRWKFWE